MNKIWVYLLRALLELRRLSVQDRLVISFMPLICVVTAVLAQLQNEHSPPSLRFVTLLLAIVLCICTGYFIIVSAYKKTWSFLRTESHVASAFHILPVLDKVTPEDVSRWEASGHSGQPSSGRKRLRSYCPFPAGSARWKPYHSRRVEFWKRATVHNISTLGTHLVLGEDGSSAENQEIAAEFSLALPGDNKTTYGMSATLKWDPKIINGHVNAGFKFYFR